MFGLRFVKVPPTTYLMRYQGGKVLREGAGLSFFYFAPTSSLVAVPVGSRDEGFIFGLTTADFQQVTVQGQVTYRIIDPHRIAALLDFTLRPDGRSHATEDPDKLPLRVVRTVEVLCQQAVKGMTLKETLLAPAALATRVSESLKTHPEMTSLGLEVLNVSIVAIKPAPETAKALEAQARELILGGADDAIFARRNAAVANERAIRESELDTEIAVEQKKRMIKEAQLEAEASLRKRQQELRAADMEADVLLEENRKAFVVKNAENTRTLAEAEAYRVGAVMDALKSSDPRVVQALMASGMQPGQLIAQAFGGIAEKAERIGQFNISPELLQSLMRPAGENPPKPAQETRRGRDG